MSEVRFGEVIDFTSKRELILRATAALCMERGYAETSVADVVALAGVSEAEFADLFKDREECLLAAVRQILGETMSAVAYAYSGDRPETESAIAGVKGILELMAGKPAYAYLGYVVSRQLGPKGARELYAAGLQMLIAMLERLSDHSETPVPPASAGRGAMGGAEALVRRMVIAGEAEQLPRALPDLVYVAVVAFLGQEEALDLARRARLMLRGTVWATDAASER